MRHSPTYQARTSSYERPIEHVAISDIDQSASTRVTLAGSAAISERSRLLGFASNAWHVVNISQHLSTTGMPSAVLVGKSSGREHSR